MRQGMAKIFKIERTPAAARCHGHLPRVGFNISGSSCLGLDKARAAQGEARLPHLNSQQVGSQSGMPLVPVWKKGR
jgi:hypothetical protein